MKLAESAFLFRTSRNLTLITLSPLVLPVAAR